ncbi:MAG: TetR/AcrR family transcriptional regulator [bacterium]|nr:TetR/AcrR family transcriptional regulator [bacterium]
MTLRQPAQTRERLLAAALHQMREHGSNGLTLDVVAKEAGVSKGGLLHHFPSKNALIEALLRQLFSDFEGRVQHYYEAEPPAPGRLIRAYIRATFEEEPLPLELTMMLMGDVAHNPALMTMIREDFQRWHERLLADGLPPARATILRQAADSYWTERLIFPDAPAALERQQIVDELLRLSVVE